MNKAIQRMIDEGVKAMHADAASWLPKERLRRTWTVKYREGAREWSTVFGSEAAAVSKVAQVLDRPHVDEVFLVLQIQKVNSP